MQYRQDVRSPRFMVEQTKQCSQVVSISRMQHGRLCHLYRVTHPGLKATSFLTKRHLILDKLGLHEKAPGNVQNRYKCETCARLTNPPG